MIARQTYSSHHHWGREPSTVIHALPGIGQVLVSRSRHVVTGNEALRGVPVVSLLWWEKPVRCPSLFKEAPADDGLYPIFRTRPFAQLNKSPLVQLTLF